MEILRYETPRKKYTYALRFTCKLMSSVVQNEMVESELFKGGFTRIRLTIDVICSSKSLQGK
jgi:hypothetical protein